MCYKICDFDVEAQTYVEAWKASSTKNELFQRLDESDVWENRRQRLLDRAAPYDTYSGRWIKTMRETNPGRYTTWKMAKYMHKALQRKGVLLPEWTSIDYHCLDSALPLAMRLNKTLAS